jgi:hypothetical protein
MPDVKEHSLIPPEQPHPRCPVCSLPMWLMRLDHVVPGEPLKDKLHYQCQVCDAKAVLPPLVE